jgi:hypothetical protein
MTPEERILCACTRQEFSAAHQTAVTSLCVTSPIRWNVLWQAATYHGVAPLVYVNLCNCAAARERIPTQVARAFQDCASSNGAIKMRRARILRDMLALCGSFGIHVLLLKGVAADAVVFKEPWYTQSGDVDVVTRQTEPEIPTSHVKILYSHYGSRDDFELEYGSHHDVNLGGALPVRFDRVWQDAVQSRFYGEPAFVMCPEDLLVCACINSCRRRFLRLKPSLEIAETVSGTPGLDWQKVARIAQQSDCAAMVYAALLAADRTVGCALPKSALDGLPVSSFRATVIRKLVGSLSPLALPALRSLLDRGPMKVAAWEGTRLLLPAVTYRWYQLGLRLRGIWKKACQDRRRPLRLRQPG